MRTALVLHGSPGGGPQRAARAKRVCRAARFCLALPLAPLAALAQQPAPAPQAIAYVPTEGVSLSGQLSVANGRAAIGNNATVTAADRSALVTIARGGSLRVCASTSVHLSRDAQPLTGAVRPASGADDAGLMVALDRGALEAHYTTGKYSDVLLTPDLRLLISGPGVADLKLRVNRQGDTCVDNRGDNAPYVTVSSLMDGGVYRVQANQRVLFEHGSLQQVVDREAEPCGCPDTYPDTNPRAEPSTAQAGDPGGRPDDPRGAHSGGPSSTPADTAFPIAVSEGLAAPAAGPTSPVVPLGQPHAQVTATLSNDPAPAPPGGAAATAPPAPAPAPVAARKPGLLHKVGRFFARIFGQAG